MTKDIISPGKIANMLGLSARKVCQLIDSKELKGWRVPGIGGHRRCLVSDVVAFAEKHGMPILTAKTTPASEVASNLSDA